MNASHHHAPYRQSAVAGAVILLILMPGLVNSAPAGEPVPLPISCLYLHDSIGDPGKTGGTARIHECSFYPAAIVKRPGNPGDSLSTLVILIDWDDHPAEETTGTKERFEKMYFLATGSGIETMTDYYLEVSGGAFHPTGSVTPWLRSNDSYSHYVNGDGAPGTADDSGFDTSVEAFLAEPYPANVWGAVREAVELAYDSGVDFSRFDNDGPDGIPSSGDDDGTVDALVVVHSGPGAETIHNSAERANLIWSHKGDMLDPAVLALIDTTFIDGISIGPYNFVPEVGQVGVYAHEYGHILGLPDIYRTYIDNGTMVQESTVGVFCIMDAGSLLPLQQEGSTAKGSVPSHMNPLFKAWLGWLDPAGYDGGGPEEIESISLAAIEREGGAVRLLANPGGYELGGRGASGEYFLLENRYTVGFDGWIPGEGLLIWHTNEEASDNSSDDIDRRLLSIVEPDGGCTGEIAFNLGDDGDFWPQQGKRDWTWETNPSTALYGGSFTGIALTDIRSMGQIVSFDLHPKTVRAGAPYAFPNPFHPSDGEAVTIACRPEGVDAIHTFHVTIFDLAGRRVRMLDHEGVEIEIGADATAQAFWDGRNDGGRDAASGIYIYIAQINGTTDTGKIALMR